MILLATITVVRKKERKKREIKEKRKKEISHSAMFEL